ncbi:MAG: SCP2 sterol-binding domain-containing protein [Deltaproteobacteria bacterium]|nr:SCP2 sterol-binding domain-containing protein [Deltaproteobacteria bacterium]MBW2218508.1 SCP2 sterol-binding domain-containing protein [Deltaproteobacteria bacterium]
MGIQMGTEEWASALKDEVNKSDGYRMASQNWEDDFYFIVTKGGPITEDLYVYLDLWHGECREALRVSDPGARSPSFAISAPLDIWKKVVSRDLNPLRGIMTRQLKLKGNMLTLFKAPKSAIELVECAIRIDTEWP